MSSETETPVHAPQTVGELLNLTSTYPDAFKVSGGLSLMSKESNAARIIDLRHVPEFSRIKRTDRYMDIGPILTYSKLANIGRHVVPECLTEALNSIRNPVLRNEVTIGGSICRALPHSDLLTVLFALDAQVELKRTNATRWLPVSRFVRGVEETALENGEVLTRIRVPFEDWSVQVYRKVNQFDQSKPPWFTFCGLIRVLKGIIQDVRISIGAVNPKAFRDRSLETPLVGRKLPLRTRERTTLISELTEKLLPPDPSRTGRLYLLETVARMIRWFLEEMNQIHIYR